MDIHDLCLFRRMLCSLSPHIRTWWGNPPMFLSTSVGWSGLSCFSLAICGPAWQGRTAAEKAQLQVRPGRHPGPDPTRVLQHLRAHGPARGRPYGSYGRAEAVRALTHAHSVCGPRRRCAGPRALDAPLPPWQLYSDYPTPVQPAPGRRVFLMGWQMQPMSRAGREATCTTSTNGCGSLDGANRVWGACRWLRLRSGA